MSNQKNTSTEAVDAVEEALALDESSVDSASEDEATAKTKAKAKSTEETQSKLSMLLEQVASKVKSIDLSAIKDKVNLSDDKKEKLRAFATSNVGITVIVLTFVVIFISANVYRLRHKNHHQTTVPTVSSDSQWGRPIPRHHAISSPAPSEQKAHALDAGNYVSHHARNRPTQIVASKRIMQMLSDIHNQMQSLNQRMMVISQQLAHSTHHHTVNHHYRVLGWRLDQDTNQWIADIEYAGKVKAYYAGQRFGHWTVRSVSSTGVKIR